MMLESGEAHEEPPGLMGKNVAPARAAGVGSTGATASLKSSAPSALVRIKNTSPWSVSEYSCLGSRAATKRGGRRQALAA